MSLTFPLAGDADIEQVLAFMRGFYAIDAYPFDEHIMHTTLADLIHTPAFGRVWLIHVDGVPIGYLVLTLGYSLEYHGRDACIDEVFIQAEHRGQGSGMQAILFAEEVCHDLGVHTVYLEVERGNIAGQRLYRNAGFEDRDRYVLLKWID